MSFNLRSLTTPLVALLLLSAPALPQASASSIPFQSLVRDVLDRSGLGEAEPDTFSAEEYLALGYVRLRLGLFEVYMDRESASNTTDADHYLAVCGSMLTLQECWLDWLEPSVGKKALKEPRKDLKEVSKWLSRVRGGQVANVAKGLEPGVADPNANLYEGLRAKVSLRAVAEHLAEVMGTGALMGLDRPDQPEPIVLASRRRQFMEWISLAGWVYPELQPTFWNDDVSGWTQFYMDRVKVMALEFASAGAGPGNWTAGTAMNEKVDTGMEQQLTQLATNSLVDSYFGDKVPESFAAALSVNLVIDVFGECQTRVDGDLRSRRTEAYERFVPGGLSEGGWLPAIAADSWWRVESNHGSDRFVGPLHVAQSNGFKDTKERYNNFRLHNDAGSKTYSLQAPLLGLAAADMPIPPESFRGDYKELLRAYRTAFVHWLRSERSKDAEDLFAALLLRLATGGEDLEAVLADMYGQPLSSAEVSKGDLEGEFLRWVSRR